MYAELDDLERQLEAAQRDVEALCGGLSEAQGAWRAGAAQWSIAQCLDHLAITNQVYLEAMREAARDAREHGRVRRGPARPGVFGRIFVRTLEPPPKMRVKAPRKIEPAPSPPLAAAVERFRTAQGEVRAFLRENADLDLPGAMFPNPFVRGLRVSVATALHAIPAHERRHIWQAWEIRRAMDGRASRASA